MEELIKKIVDESLEVKKEFFLKNLPHILQVIELIRKALSGGNKLLIFGNGGSAADSQHMAAELVNRFKAHGKPLPAISLTTDSSVLTSISNDHDFSQIFSKQIQALGKKGDVALGITTSGRSRNVIEAFISAKQMGICTICLTGGDGGEVRSLADYCIIVESHSTQRIQETHLMLEHIICEAIDLIFP